MEDRFYGLKSIQRLVRKNILFIKLQVIEVCDLAKAKMKIINIIKYDKIIA